MDFKQYRDFVVIPTLRRLADANPKLNCVVSQELILGVVAHESGNGRWIKQVRGPALGFPQIEPATLEDLYINYLDYRPNLRLALDSEKVKMRDREEQLVTNLSYAVAACRLILWRAPDPLPERHEDTASYILSLGAYWKKHYNTEKGKGTVEQFVSHYPMDALR